ncbi:hypothetical protein KF707_01520 [Candidatus Obscuribacterales bacterium]|nr:hypothetical protein [Candidatus Obscuribacterales bacterium]MBX3153980.1 hypothetical protein [Candidatus Obscuribacterales bacterium]
MKKQNATRTAAFLALYMVSTTFSPVVAAESFARSSKALHSSGFSIAINEILPESSDSTQEALPDESQPPVEQQSSALLRNEVSQATDDETSEIAQDVVDIERQQDGEQTATAEKKGFFSSWSLPISGPLVFSLKRQQLAQKSKELSGSISFEDPYESASQHIEGLLECALARDSRSESLEKAVTHYRKKTQIVIAESKDAINHVVPFRGFGPSAEAGNIITGEKLEIKSRAAAEYARQKHVDELHVKVVSSMMQISMGLGMTDQERGQTVTASGVEALTQLVGEEEAEKAKAQIASMASQLSVDDEVFKKPTWDVQERQKLHRQIMELSLDDDPVVHQIKKHIHKYNQKSKFAMVSSSVVQTMLGAASMTPTFVGPAAKTALVAFVMATGGPEQCKLLKELYLDKRLESRWKVLNEEAHMAVENYQLAVLTKNPTLLCYSESIVGQMVGGHHVNEVFGTTLLAKKTESPKTM